MKWEKEKEAIFLKNLVQEIQLYHTQYGKISIDTIFFGGGTPNVIKKKSFEKIVDTIHNAFDVDSNVEFSMEMNPGIHSKTKLKFFSDMGVNRVSVGAQSFNETVLSDYGRNHSSGDTVKFIDDLVDIGISNINVDVIFGHPNHNKQALEQSLKIVTDMSIPHVATYGLTIAKGTDFHTQKVRINDDDQADQYVLIQDYLESNEIYQYEVSNFSRKGYESKHNIKYWMSQPTIGLGAGAHSYFYGHRYCNENDYKKYINAINLPTIVNEKQNWNDYIGARLRYNFPIYFLDIYERFELDVKEKFSAFLKEMANSKFINLYDDYFWVTNKGFVVLDELLLYFLSD